MKIHQFDDVFWANGDTRTAVAAEFIVDVNHNFPSNLNLVRDIRLEPVSNSARIQVLAEGKLKPVHNLLVKRHRSGGNRGAELVSNRCA